MKKSKNRLKKKQEERNHIKYQLLHTSDITNNKDTLDNHKQSLSSSQIIQYIQALERNDSSKFGICQIFKYNLLINFPISSCHIQWKSRVDYFLNNSNERINEMTLLDYAILLNRDVIIGSFIRSGNYPFPLDDYDLIKKEMLHNEMIIYLNKIPQYFAIWIVKYVFALKLLSNNQNQSSSLVQLYPCQHHISIDLFWKHIIGCNQSKFYISDLTCPICDIILQVDPCLQYISLPNPILVLTTSNDKHQSPLDKKLQSLQKFQSLPDDLISNEIEKRPKIQALPYSQVVNLFSGTTKSGRMFELFKAIIDNNKMRLFALLEAGVNVDEVNEYGQTPFFYCSLLKRYDLCTILKEYDANESICDNMKYTSNDLLNEFDTMRYFTQDMLESSNETYNIVTIIDKSLDHPGAGACFMDNFLSNDLIQKLAFICHDILPFAIPEKNSCSQRKYYCDIEGIVCKALENAITMMTSKALAIKVHPFMRFLIYNERGASLAPHIDLSKTWLDFNISDVDVSFTSNYTFILYLTDCDSGGSTLILEDVKNRLLEENIIDKVQPHRNRLLIYPHNCPHAGDIVDIVPKILLRGEVCIT